MRVTSFAALMAAAAQVSAVGLIAAAGCGGSDRPPMLADEVAPEGGVKPGQSLDFDGSTKPQSCNSGPSNGVCGCVDLTLLSDVPNIYFVLDRSGSMNDGDKWASVRAVVADVVRRLGPRAKIGAALFPGRGGGCVPGEEVMPMRSGDAPAGAAGRTMFALLDATNEPAAGGTPTSATMRALTPRIMGLPGRTFVILATDGGPNCNAQASCGFDQCMPNIEKMADICKPEGPLNCCTPDIAGVDSCLDGDALISAVSALRAASIPTYVIGVPGTDPYGSLLDKVARAGGTARDEAPHYYRVSTAERAALGGALAKVAAKITATCELPLTDVPDPERVNVYLDDHVVPREPENGWVLDGLTVRLVGATCDRVLAGEALNVRVVAGCPTVTPR